MTLNWLWDVLFPSFCISCGKFGDYVCDDCIKLINFYNPQTCPYCEMPSPHGLTHPRCQKRNGLDGMFVLAHYDGLVRDIIHRIKYQGEFAILKDMSKIMIKNYHHKFKFDYFVPVPLSRKREDERGFNQAYKLAQEFKTVMLACPASVTQRDSGCAPRAYQNDELQVINLLTRTRNTKPQFDLSYRDRQKNVSDAFALSPSLTTQFLGNFSFCLIDDVSTTGATIFECAKVLKRAGAMHVCALVLCRGG
jgi:ComF family protein